MVEDINYKDHLISEYSKSEKAVRFKLLNIESLLNSMDIWENDPDNSNPSLFNYLNRITLLSRDNGDDENDKGKVNLMTIHASKGLEFPVVFIAGAEEGLIPHARSVEENGGNVEEERRLFYVAITRAKEKLFINYALTRRDREGKEKSVLPSRFIEEIPTALLQSEEKSKEQMLQDNVAKGRQFLEMLKNRDKNK